MIFLLFRSFFAKEQENLKSVPSSNQSQSVSMFNNQRTLSKDEYVDIGDKLILAYDTTKLRVDLFLNKKEIIDNIIVHANKILFKIN